MTRLLCILAVGAVAASGLLRVAAQTGGAAQEPDAAREQMEKISYGLGYYPGSEMSLGLKIDGVQADANLAIQGFTDGLKGAAPAMPEEEIHAVLVTIEREIQKRVAQRLVASDPQFRQVHVANLAHSLEFHEEFGKREGVVTMPDGVQYKVLQPGTGATPQPRDTVVLNVRMLLTDGREILNWQGAAVRVDHLIEGGAKVLLMMKAGAQWVVAVPPDLAFGAVGKPPDIGPNETIIFQVELLDVRQGKAQEGKP